MLTLRMLQSSRLAMLSVVAFASVGSSSSQRRPREIDATNVTSVVSLFHTANRSIVPAPVESVEPTKRLVARWHPCGALRQKLGGSREPGSRVWGYNNLQWLGGTYYHKFNDQWHPG
jgi:hypothetical protein